MTTGRPLAPVRTLTAEQRASYGDNGFLVVPQRVPGAFLAGVQSFLEALVDLRISVWRRDELLTDDHDDLGFGSRYHQAWVSAGRPEGFAAEPDQRSLAHALADLARERWLTDLAAELLDAPQVRPIDSCFCRARFPGEDSTSLPWHQDAPCVGPIAGLDFLTLWIPLVDVTPTTSCLEVAPVGRDHLIHEPEWSDQLGYLFMRDTDVARLTDVRPVAMRRGDALVLSPRLPHRSLPNAGPLIRWSVDFRYAPA